MIQTEKESYRFISPSEAVSLGFRPKEHVIARISTGMPDAFVLDEVASRLALGSSAGQIQIETGKHWINRDSSLALTEIKRSDSPKPSFKDYVIYLKNTILRKSPQFGSIRLTV